jgi:hypothetical protein
MRKYPNKKKRTCYSCGSTEHFIMDWIAQMRKKRASMTRTRGITRRTKGNTPKKKNYGGEAHIGHECNSGVESSNDEEENKVATIVVKKPSSTSKPFNNLSNNEGSSNLNINLPLHLVMSRK